MKILDESKAIAVKAGHILPPLSQLRVLKLRSTLVQDASLGRLLGLCATTLVSLDISFSEIRSLDILTRALSTLVDWKLEKLVISGLPLSITTLLAFFSHLAERPLQQRTIFRKLKIGSMPDISIAIPGLSDAGLSRLLPFLEKLGLRSVSLFQNFRLARDVEPMRRFMNRIGRSCTVSYFPSCSALLPAFDFTTDGS